MSVELNVRDWNDEEYDSCCRTAIATLKIDCIKIPLCMECIEELKEQLERFCKPQYCYQCKYFKMSRSGWNYGGSCCKDKDISDDLAGYECCKGCMSFCKDFVIKENNNE